MADNETSPATATEKNEKISRQEKIILCSALISLFFCCVTLALPAPFLPKLVSFYAFLKVNVIIRYLYTINFSSWTPLLTVVLINSLHSSCWKLPPQRKGNSTVIEIITSLLILLYRKSQQIFTCFFLVVLTEWGTQPQLRFNRSNNWPDATGDADAVCSIW